MWRSARAVVANASVMGACTASTALRMEPAETSIWSACSAADCACGGEAIAAPRTVFVFALTSFSPISHLLASRLETRFHSIARPGASPDRVTSGDSGNYDADFFGGSELHVLE